MFLGFFCLFFNMEIDIADRKFYMEEQKVKNNKEILKDLNATCPT